MNFRTTLILLILLVGGLVFVLFANREGAPEPKKEAVAFDPKGRKLFDADSGDFDRLTIKPAAGQAIDLVKEAGQWKLTGPIDWPADGGEVGRLVDAVAGLRSRGRVDLTSGNQAALGLDKPRYAIDASGKSGAKLAIKVGNRSTLGNDLYVSTGDDKSAELAVGATLAERLDKNVDKVLANLRDKALVKAQTWGIKQLRLESRGKKLSLEKRGEDWEIVEPVKLKADNTAVSDLLFAVTGLRADEFLSSGAEAASAAGGFDQPKLTVWFSSDAPATQPATAPGAQASATQPAPVTITFGQFADVEQQKMYVRVSNPAALAKVSMAAASLEKLTGASPLTLRDKKVLDVDPAQVSKLSADVDVPATTQPTTMSADKRLVRVERRKEDAAPAMPSPLVRPLKPPTTQAATTPATIPATTPAAAEAAAKPAARSPEDEMAMFKLPESNAAPKSPWEIVSDPQGPADEARVAALLGSLHPLKAEKFLEKSPATQPSDVRGRYVVKVTSVGPGGTPVTDYEVRLTDRPGDAPLVGNYNGLWFEVNRSILKALEGDFKSKMKAEAPPAAPEGGFPGGGFPGGGFPGGFPGQ